MIKHIIRKYQLIKYNNYNNSCCWRRSIYGKVFRNNISNNKNDEVLVRIGKGTEYILSDMENFCSKSIRKPIPSSNIYSRNMTFSVQNGPDNILLKVTGRWKYRLMHRSIRHLMPLFYGFCYDNLSCGVYPLGPARDLHKLLPNEPVEVKVKWVLRGCHRSPFFLYQPSRDKNQSEKETLLEAYCVFVFDRNSGRVISHVIDWVEIVPPLDLQLEFELANAEWSRDGRVAGSTAAASSSNACCNKKTQEK